MYDLVFPRTVDAVRRALLTNWRACAAAAALLAGLLPAPAHAAAGGWPMLAPAVFEHLAPERGLPHPVVMSLAQDGDGFMWFGTQGGLARWDGYRMRNFFYSASDAASLPGDFIQTLHVDRLGRLWIGTTTDGVAMYDKLHERFVRYPAGTKGLSSPLISAIAGDDKGGVWVGTAAGLDYIDTAGGSMARISHYPRGADAPGGPRANQIRALLLDHDGNLWIGSNAGLARRDASDGRVVDVAVAGGAGDAVLALASGERGQVAFGTFKSGVGMAGLVDGAPVARIVALDRVKDAGSTMVLSITETEAGQWWAATYGGGIIEFDAAGHGRRIVHRPAVQSSLANDRVAAVWRDRSGLVWLANERGIDINNPANHTIDTVVDGEGMQEVSVSAFMTDSAGRLWTALGDQGIDLVGVDGRRTAGLRPDPAHLDTMLPNRLVLAMAEAEPQEAWIGTLLGLYHTSAHGQRVTRVPLPQADALPRISSIVRLDGALWLATGGGLLRYDPLAGSVQSFGAGPASAGGLSDGRVTTLLADPDGALWVGTRKGLNRFDPATGKAEQLLVLPGNAAARAHGFINSLAFDARGRLWVATNNDGISILEGRAPDGTRRYHRLGIGDGLPTNTITGLRADQAGRMWVSSVDGLVLIDGSTLRVRKLGRADGLVFLSYYAGAVGQTVQSDIVFGTSGGYTVVHPTQPFQWTYQPPLVLSSVRLDKRAVPAAALMAAGGAGLIVPAGTRGVEVEVAALDFSASQRNRYASWLEGYDKDWVETDSSRRIAAYNNLAPGHYRLRLRGSNRDGVWSPHELAIDMQVLPAWYQTWWARCAAALAGLALAWGVYRWRVSALRRTQAMLQRLVLSRTRHLEKVHAIVKSINEQLDFDALLQTILFEASASTGVDACYALIGEAGTAQLAIRATWRRDGLPGRLRGMTQEQAQARYVNGAKAIAPDIYVGRQGAGAVLVVRISIAGQVAAYLVFEHGAPMANADLDLFIALREPFVSAFQKAEAIRAIQQARADAEASTRAKSDFLANISHEIRTPMNAIIGFAGLGAHLDVAPQPRDYFHKIGRAGQNLLGIINDVLDFSRIESGKLELEAVPFDLTDTLGQIADLFSWRAAEKGLELLVCAAPDVPQGLIGDPLRLSQVLINLVGNALKFTPRGFIFLRVERARDQGKGHSADQGAIALAAGGQPLRLQFSVEDSGVGISLAQQSRLFHAFSQADASTTRLHGGTGLGLAISQQLVQAMGGVIAVDSTPGTGSRFNFTITLQAQPAAALRRAPPEAIGKKVLIVDDSAPTRAMLEQLLGSFGFVARSVDSGAAALQLLRDDPHEVVLMDWNMPDLDGIETTRRLHDDPALTVLPTVLMVTEFTREHIRHEAELAGVAAFLTKPVNPGQLFGAVLAALGFEPPRAPEPAAAPAPLSAAALRLRGARVLVVDDSVINQQVARDVLLRAGVLVDLAGGGLEATRMVDQSRYDAVLMDIQMPAMDGYQATSRIRERNQHAGLPVIAMTAHAVAGFREASLAAGMNDFVTKPIDPETLYAVLVSWLAPEPAVAGAPAPQPAPAGAPPPHGIDRAAALARLGGNEALLATLLRRFLDDFAGAPELILAAIGRGRFDDAAALVHRLRGAAGNLSMPQLQRSAGELEELLLAPGRGPLDSALAAFGNALETVIDGVRAADAGEDSAPRQSAPVSP